MLKFLAGLRNSKTSLWLINLSLLAVIALPVIFFVLLATPIIGNVIVVALGTKLGCGGSAAAPQPCYFLGKDFGGIYYNYAMTVVALGITNPVLAVSLFKLLLTPQTAIAWLATIAGLFVARDHLKSRSRAHG